MSPTKVRTIILASFLVVITIIPVVAFVLSQNFRSSSSANATPSTIKSSTTKTQVASKSGSILDIPGAETPIDGLPEQTPSPSPSAASVISGPTLGFKVSAEGRTTGDQTNKVFVGITQGNTPSSTPNYLLSFTVDVPTSGEFNQISLAGLTPGTSYTAYLKGQAQIATSSAFLMLPSTSTLNNGFALKLTTGDVNDDNVINQADYDIVRAYFGTTRASSNWNPILDFNLDGIINGFELGMISNRIGQTGATTGTTGPWISTPTGSPTSALPTNSNIGGQTNRTPTEEGYWMWIPNFDSQEN